MSKPPPEIAERVAFHTEMAADLWDRRGMHFVYVRIPEPLLPEERGEKYEEPLHDVLHAAGLGRVNGGGQQLGEGNTIEYCGVDVLVTDLEQGLALLLEELPKLGAPKGTVVEVFRPEFVEHPV